MTPTIGLLPTATAVRRPALPVEAFAVVLTFRGVRLWHDGDRVRWNAPAGAMSVQLLREIKTREWELAALLRRDPAAGEPTYEGNPR